MKFERLLQHRSPGLTAGAFAAEAASTDTQRICRSYFFGAGRANPLSFGPNHGMPKRRPLAVNKSERRAAFAYVLRRWCNQSTDGFAGALRLCRGLAGLSRAPESGAYGESHEHCRPKGMPALLRPWPACRGPPSRVRTASKAAAALPKLRRHGLASAADAANA